MSARHRQLKKQIAERKATLAGLRMLAKAYNVVLADMACRSGDTTAIEARYSYVQMRVEEVWLDIVEWERALAAMPSLSPSTS